jgi:hypothetical protein
MLVYGLLFLLLATAVAYTVIALARWVREPGRRVSWRPLLGVLLPAVAAWTLSFFVPFASEWMGRGGDTIVEAIWLLALIGAASVAARTVTGVWAPISGGAVLAGAVWAAAIGIFLMHAVGWQGLTMDDLGSDSGVARVWVGALFFSPGAFALGFLLGGLWQYASWRGRARTA